MPYKDDRDRCESHLRYLRAELTVAKRAARRIPNIETQINQWSMRLKQHRSAAGHLAKFNLVGFKRKYGLRQISGSSVDEWKNPHTGLVVSPCPGGLVIKSIRRPGWNRIARPFLEASRIIDKIFQE